MYENFKYCSQLSFEWPLRTATPAEALNLGFLATAGLLSNGPLRVV